VTVDDEQRSGPMHEVIVANPTELYGTKRGRRRKKRNDKIDAEYLAGLRQTENLTEKQGQCNAFTDELIEELQAADVVVIAVAMINFSIPSSLKAFT
jgi:NAD(P)H-dependent FMN reductase